MSLEKSCPETLQTQGNKEKSERSGVDTLTKRKPLIEHYEFCIDILVIINADDKLLIKEMSKKASVHRNHPLLLSIRTSVHCTSSANNEKRRRQKGKKRFVWLLSRLFNRMFFHCFCKCVLHVHTCIFIYLNCRNYVLSLFKKNINSAKRQNLWFFWFKKKFLSNVRSTACSTWRDSQYLVISKLWKYM